MEKRERQERSKICLGLSSDISDSNTVSFQVLKKKKETPPEKVCAGMEKEYPLMYNDLMKLKFEDTPNYAWYHQLLRAIAARKQYRENDPFDWEEGGTGYESVMKSMVAPNAYEGKDKADQFREKEKLPNAEPSEKE